MNRWTFATDATVRFGQILSAIELLGMGNLMSILLLLVLVVLPVLLAIPFASAKSAAAEKSKIVSLSEAQELRTPASILIATWTLGPHGILHRTWTVNSALIYRGPGYTTISAYSKGSGFDSGCRECHHMCRSDGT